MKKEFSQLRMGLNTWNIVLENLAEENEEVEIVWMDSCGDDKELGYALCHDCEMFEYGFETEKEANERLQEIYVMSEMFTGFILPQLDEQLEGEWLNKRQYAYLVSKSESIVKRMQQFYNYYDKNNIELEAEIELEYLDSLFSKMLHFGGLDRD